MQYRKLSKHLGTIAVVGGLTITILLVGVGSAAATGTRVFMGGRVGRPIFVHRPFVHPFFVHRTFVGRSFVPFVSTPVVVKQVTIVSTTVVPVTSRVVFVTPARFVFRQTFVVTPVVPFFFHRPFFVSRFDPFIVTPFAVDRVIVASSTTSMASSTAVVTDPPAAGTGDPPAGAMPGSSGLPERTELATQVPSTSAASASAVVPPAEPRPDAAHWVWNGSQWEWHMGERIWIPRQWTWKGNEWIWAGGRWAR